jgi:hypothetical protein
MAEHPEVIIIDSSDEESVPNVPAVLSFASMPNVKRNKDHIAQREATPEATPKKVKTSHLVVPKSASLKDETDETDLPKYETDQFGKIKYETVLGSIPGTYRTVPMLVKTEAEKMKAAATKLRRKRGMGPIAWKAKTGQSIDGDLDAALLGLLQSQSREPKTETKGNMGTVASTAAPGQSIKAEPEMKVTDKNE